MKIEVGITTLVGFFSREKLTTYEIGDVPMKLSFVHLSLFMNEEVVRLILTMRKVDGEIMNFEKRIEVHPTEVKAIGIYCDRMGIFSVGF